MIPNRPPVALLAVALACGAGAAARAQTAPQPAAAESAPDSTAAPAPAPSAAPRGGLDLESVVITGTSSAASKMKQSVSVSSMGSEQIEKTGAASAAEVLRSIPGVRAESSGGEGNANLTVRGVPISAGGARYVQMQEDGLPLLMFGDIQFGTADQFLRVDPMLDRLEVVRGGSASTLASNSPGGLVNFISRTGENEGGEIGLGIGLGQRTTRLDFGLGGSLGPTLRYQIGGFQRVGEGARDAGGMNVEDGGQFRGNITKLFDAGFVRVSFKHLDDSTPAYLPVPVRVVNGQIRQLPGIDPRTAYFINPNLGADTTIDRNGNPVTSKPRDGLHVESDALGVEAQIAFGDGWKLSERFRRAKNRGRFIGLFPADNGNDGTTPFTATLFNTSLDNLDNTFNDVRLGHELKLPNGAKLNVNGGLFYGSQNIAQTWFWNQYGVESRGEGAAIVDASGNPTTQPVTSGWDTWGGCCARVWDTEYTQTAPYLAATFETGPLSLDASVRRDRQRASGWYQSGDAVTRSWDEAGRQRVDYTVSHTSYSVGANFQVDRNLATFARYSDGVAYAADRLLYSTPLDGSEPINVNEVKQFEAGVKWRRGAFGSFLTFFDARTNESNYELTSQEFSTNAYRSRGIEAELSWRAGSFRVAGGATYTHARIKDTVDGSNVGNTPRRQAKWLYQLAPSYTWDTIELGAAIAGTSKAFGDDANTITMPSYVVVNPYLSWQVTSQAQLAVSINNVTNELGYTEIEGDGHAARAVNGRTARATFKYAF